MRKLTLQPVYNLSSAAGTTGASQKGVVHTANPGDDTCSESSGSCQEATGKNSHELLNG